MDVDRPPTEITRADEYWVRCRDVADAPRVDGDWYFSRYDVTPPDATTADELPPADGDAVRAIDRRALRMGKLAGKWQVTGSAERVERLWPGVIEDVADGVLWAAKAMTATGREELPYDYFVVAIYTPNYFERDDVGRVRDRLRDEHGVCQELRYKPDIYTAMGIVGENADEWGLSTAARYLA